MIKEIAEIQKRDWEYLIENFNARTETFDI